MHACLGMYTPMISETPSVLRVVLACYLNSSKNGNAQPLQSDVRWLSDGTPHTRWVLLCIAIALLVTAAISYRPV